MIKTFDFLLFAVNGIMFGGMFYTGNHPTTSPSEIETEAEYIDYTYMSPKTAAERAVGRMISYALAGDLNSFYKTVNLVADYQDSLTPYELERNREATEEVLNRREEEINDVMQVINIAYENADPATKANMDRFFKTPSRAD